MKTGTLADHYLTQPTQISAIIPLQAFEHRGNWAEHKLLNIDQLISQKDEKWVFLLMASS